MTEIHNHLPLKLRLQSTLKISWRLIFPLVLCIFSGYLYLQYAGASLYGLPIGSLRISQFSFGDLMEFSQFLFRSAGAIFIIVGLLKFLIIICLPVFIILKFFKWHFLWVSILSICMMGIFIVNTESQNPNNTKESHPFGHFWPANHNKLEVVENYQPLDDDTSKEPLPDIALIILESVRGDYFNRDNYKNTFDFLQHHETIIRSDMIAAGNETIVSLPRIFFAKNQWRNQTFECRNSPLSNLEQKYHFQETIWTSERFSWHGLGQLLRCGKVALINQTTIKSKISSTEGPNLSHELTYAVNDKYLLQQFSDWVSSEHLKTQNASQFILVHNYNTHYPYTTIKKTQENQTFDFFKFLNDAIWGYKETLITYIKGMYTMAIRDNDGFVLQILNSLEQRAHTSGRPTLVVVTGDHGELLGEQGQVLHSALGGLQEAVLRVPFVLTCLKCNKKMEAQIQQIRQRIADQWISHIDIMPTILGFVDSSMELPSDGCNLANSCAQSSRDLVSSNVDQTRLAIYHRPFKVTIDSITGAQEVINLDQSDTREASSEIGRDIFESWQSRQAIEK